MTKFYLKIAKFARAIFPFFVIVIFGCNANYKDLGAGENEILPSDAGAGIEAGSFDAGVDSGGDGVLSTGTWSGQAGYSASGTVSLLLRNGVRRLEFSDDFRVSSVPGPFVVVSTRPSLAGDVSAQMGDVTIAALSSNRGAQSYNIPSEVDAFAYVWVYCQPFTVEIARAQLMEQP